MNEVVSVLATFAAFAAMVLAIRSRVRRLPRLRTPMILAGMAGMVLGGIVAFYLPGKVPETSGSPASLVLIFTLWIAGGGMALIRCSLFVGAALDSSPHNLE